LLTAVLLCQAAAAVGVGTCWQWETAATCRLLGGARRFGAHGWRRGAGHIVAAACLQLIYFKEISLARIQNIMPLDRMHAEYDPAGES